jgi:hypothetical protein
MTKNDIFKKELIIELKNVVKMMSEEKDIEKKIYLFSASYGITSRTFRYDFKEDYLLADFVLNATYNGLIERLNRLKSVDSTVMLENIHFERIQNGLMELALSFEKNLPPYDTLKKILSTMYSTTGPGYYIRLKGMMDF